MKTASAAQTFAAVTALSALFGPGAASAQFAPIAPVSAGDRTTEVDVIANVIYDTNVANSDSHFAALRHIKPSDEITEPEVRFVFSRPFGRQTAYVIGSAGYEFYARNSVLNRENISVEPGLLGVVGRCEYNAGGFYSRARSDIAELALTPGGGEDLVGQNNVLQVERITAGAICGRPTGLAPTVTVSQIWTQNSLPLEKFTDSSTTSVNGGIAYRRPNFGVLSLFGSYSHTSFPDREAFYLAYGLPALLAGAYEATSGGLSYTRPIGARLQGSASVSYTSLSTQGGNGGSFSGLTYSASLAYRITPRLNSNVTISRATLPSNRLNSTFRLDDLYSGELDYTLARRGLLRAGVSYEHDRYDGQAFPISFDLTRETIYTVFGGAQMPINRRLGASLTVQYAKRDANYPGLTYDDLRTIFSLRAAF